MYYCPDCGSEFEKSEESYETHGLIHPPYESVYCCPYCKGTDFFEKSTTHCRCCGIKLRKGLKDYCSESCEKRGKKLWQKELKRRKIISSDPVNILVREVSIYNKKHNTKYSYGQYVALIKPKGAKKDAKS